MRTWFWTLLLAVMAVALAVVLQSHAGNVLVLIWPYRIEMSLTLAVLLIVGLFVLVYGVLRVLGWLLAVPDRVRSWRGRRAQARDHELLERGWVGLLEGRFAQSEKVFTKLLDQTAARNRKVLAALSAGRAAHGLGEFARRDLMIDRAREFAGTDAGLAEAVATVSADMLLDQGKAADALAVLEPLQDGGARHLHTLRLLFRAERALNHHERVFTLARALLRRNAIGRDEAAGIIASSGSARLRQGMQSGDSWRQVWRDFKSDERLLPEVALAGAAAFESTGETDEAARILEAAIAVHFAHALIAAYARCDAAQVPRRIEKAEVWLQRRPNDPHLLRALGVLCLTGQLWGAAERYLVRSAQQYNDPQTHALLGSLYDRLDRAAEAVRHWRLATAVGTALPILATDAYLPAADTGSDPYRLDAEGEFLDEAGDTTATLDISARDVPAAQAEPVAAPLTTVDIEDYFDSAPIPDTGSDEFAAAEDLTRDRPKKEN